MTALDAAMHTARRLRLNENRVARSALRLIPPLDRWVHEQWNERLHLVPASLLEAEYTRALTYLKGRRGNDVGDYLEFGVFRGESMLCMRQASLAQGITNMRFVGFDSFQGMPDSKDEHDLMLQTDGNLPWKPGTLNSGYEATRRALTQAGMDWARTDLVKGWYEDTLNPETRDHLKLQRAGVVMVDCVIYSATLLALEFIAPLIRDEVVILFDDWASGDAAEKHLGERGAFDEFLAAHPEFTSREFGGYDHVEMNSGARSFVVTRTQTPD